MYRNLTISQPRQHTIDLGVRAVEGHFDEAYSMPTPKSPLSDLDDEIIQLNIDPRK
jgi:hypothetical protein